MTLLHRRRSAYRERRPRAVWAALVTAAVLVLMVLLGVLLPVLGLIGAADGLTVGQLDVPVGRIAIAIVVGYGLALGLLALCFRSRSGPVAWVLGVAAVVSALLVSLWPLLAVALAGVDQVQDVVPFLQRLIGRVLER